MKIRDFGLEIFFGRYEFSAPYLLAQSDCESLSIRELLALEPGAQEDFLDTWLGYSENDGAPALREAVSGLYTQCGPENVLLHVGAQEAIFGALNVLVEPGEHVICQFPTYQSLYEVARATGCELSLWPLHQGEDGTWGLANASGDTLFEIEGTPVALLRSAETILIPENREDGWDVVCYVIGGHLSGVTYVVGSDGNAVGGSGSIDAVELDGTTLRVTDDSGSTTDVSLV